MLRDERAEGGGSGKGHASCSAPYRRQRARHVDCPPARHRTPSPQRHPRLTNGTFLLPIFLSSFLMEWERLT